MSNPTVVLSTRVPEELGRKATLLAALRGIDRQDLLTQGLKRELAEAVEMPTVERLVMAGMGRRGRDEAGQK